MACGGTRWLFFVLNFISVLRAAQTVSVCFSFLFFFSTLTCSVHFDNLPPRTTSYSKKNIKNRNQRLWPRAYALARAADHPTILLLPPNPTVNAMYVKSLRSFAPSACSVDEEEASGFYILRIIIIITREWWWWSFGVRKSSLTVIWRSGLFFREGNSLLRN